MDECKGFSDEELKFRLLIASGTERTPFSTREAAKVSEKFISACGQIRESLKKKEKACAGIEDR